MTKQHDWQAHNMLIHQHGNEKFIRLTKRELHDAPVIQKFPRNDHDAFAMLVIMIGGGCVMLLALVLAAVRVYL